MELVDGEPIDAYCRRRGLGIEQTIRLFLEVCAAVESAHRRLVVHRDLKPANILVDREGRPKLLDFGIAKLLEDADQANLTRTAERRLTPGYASPEQVLGQPITTAADVYSLGIVLYELLTGRPAVSAASAASPAQLLDAVCRQDPPRPSTAVLQPTPPPRAHPDGRDDNRDAPPPALPAKSGDDGARKLSRRLAGDLDAIVMTALRKEPERRYPSVSALAEDLRRHLAGLPVAAHPERWGYRTGKWLRRHVVPVIAGVLVVSALSAGLLARTVEARRANREAASAERISAFLVSLLSEADPADTQGEELTVLDAVERGARRVEKELADEPLIQARLLLAIGQVFKDRGHFEPSERHLRRSLALRRRFGAPDAEVAESLEGLGDLLTLESRLDEAEAVLREALELRQGARATEPVPLSESQTLLGITLIKAGRLDEAETLFRSALDIRLDAFGEENRQVAKSLNNLAWALREKGELDEAAALYERTLALKRRLFPPSHPSLTYSLLSLAEIRAAQGDQDAALALRREALAITRKVFGEHHPDYARALGEMASQLHDMKRYDDAEAAYRRTLALQQELFPDGNMTTARTLNNLAWLLEDRGDPAAAEPLFERSLALRRKLLGSTHPAVAHALYNLARVRLRLGRPEESAKLLRRSLEIARSAGSAGHADADKASRLLAEIEGDPAPPADPP